MLSGRSGDDTYIFNMGDGHDIIRDEEEGNDRIVFGEGIRPEDIKISRDINNLYLTNKESGDQIQIEDVYYYGRNPIERIEFTDGTVWEPEYIKQILADYYGTEGNDEISAYDHDFGYADENNHIWGYGGNDILKGNDGNDELYGGSGDDEIDGGCGNDILVGGTGDDVLSGRSGNDTYIFNLGDGEDVIYESEGNDTIYFGEGISSGDIEISRDTWNLYLTNRKSGDKVTVNDFFYTTDNQVEAISTSDGYALDMKKLDIIIQTMASFEDSYGMSWQDAVKQKNDHAMDLVNQWWVKKTL